MFQIAKPVNPPVAVIAEDEPTKPAQASSTEPQPNSSAATPSGSVFGKVKLRYIKTTDLYKKVEVCDKILQISYVGVLREN